MNVDLLVPSLGRQGGGIGRYVTELRRALIECGVAADLATFRYLPGAARRSVLKAMPVGVAGDRRDGIAHFTRIHGASLLLLRRLDRSVVTVHDLGALLCPEDRAIGSALDRFLLRLSLAGMRRAGRIIAVSAFTKRCLVRALGVDPARVDAIPHGVDAGRFAPVPEARAILADRYRLAVSPEARIALYVGSEQPRKSLPTLVRALSELRRGGHAVHWLKVGPALHPPGRARLLELIDACGLTDHVTFVDTVSDDDLPLFYGAADVYVQPSVWEGFGLPVLEAMACGTPVVATSAPALAEVAGEAAHLVAPRDPIALSEAIAGVLSDSRRADDLVERGARRAREFTWEKAARLTIASYARVT